MRKNDKVICNCCGRAIREEAAVPREEFLHVEKTWGYFSEKDGEKQEFDVCEACYDEWVQGFLIPAKIHEATELL